MDFVPGAGFGVRRVSFLFSFLAPVEFFPFALSPFHSLFLRLSLFLAFLRVAEFIVL